MQGEAGSSPLRAGEVAPSLWLLNQMESGRLATTHGPHGAAQSHTLSTRVSCLLLEAMGTEGPGHRVECCYPSTSAEASETSTETCSTGKGVIRKEDEDSRKAVIMSPCVCTEHSGTGTLSGQDAPDLFCPRGRRENLGWRTQSRNWEDQKLTAGGLPTPPFSREAHAQPALPTRPAAQQPSACQPPTRADGQGVPDG